MYKVRRTNSDDPDFQKLVQLLDADLAIRDGDEHAFYDQFNKTINIKHVLVCSADGIAVGCGAFKEYNATQAEIKRMYVLPVSRGKGAAQAILTELEIWIAENGYLEAILETGKKQPEAIRLYEKSGYEITGNYGQYENVENSVCMRKILNRKQEKIL